MTWITKRVRISAMDKQYLSLLYGCNKYDNLMVAAKQLQYLSVSGFLLQITKWKLWLGEEGKR